MTDRSAAVEATCDAALAALDVLAARGLESSDVPRAWFAEMRRWARGEARPSQIAPRTRDLTALWIESGRHWAARLNNPLYGMHHVATSVRRCRSAWRRGHVVDFDDALRRTADVLSVATGDPVPACQARVRAWFDASYRGGAGAPVAS